MPDTVIVGDSLFVPITVTSRTAHGLPSGTSFSREAWVNISIIDDIDEEELLFIIDSI